MGTLQIRWGFCRDVENELTVGGASGGPQMPNRQLRDVATISIDSHQGRHGGIVRYKQHKMATGRQPPRIDYRAEQAAVARLRVSISLFRPPSQTRAARRI